MVLNYDFKLKYTPPTWFWFVVFLLSISGVFYLGLNPDLIKQWWWVLVFYNGLMGLMAIAYISVNIRRLKRDTKGGLIGSRFTWSFIKIVPILVILPVLSFYTFSFKTIQTNVLDSQQTFNSFNEHFIRRVDGLYQGLQNVINEKYTAQTERLLTLIITHSGLQKTDKNYPKKMQIFLNGLVAQGWACQITLRDIQQKIIGKTRLLKNCGMTRQQTERLPNSAQLNDTIQVEMSTKSNAHGYLEIHAIYHTGPDLLSFVERVKRFGNATSLIKFSLNTSITQKRFLIDFSSTILLTILSVLMIVFRMMDHLMKPLHNLSLATKEIATGNYDVQVTNLVKNRDMRELVKHFNEMSKQIKRSREGLDTHNLYLETILKYSYGVIGLDRDWKIQLINPVIGKMLNLTDERVFVGKVYDDIARQYTYLEPLFAMVTKQFTQTKTEWDEQIEIALPNQGRILLACQGATLHNDNRVLGYVIVIKDISQLNQAQKKAAWSEVAVRMAHEIKNPLTPILLSAQRLRSKFLDTLDGKDLEIMDKTTHTIISQVKSMDTMVSAFAEYANAPSVQRIPFNLNALIRQSTTLYDAHPKVHIRSELSTNMPDLFLDPNSIARVLLNLVKNATESASDQRDLTIKIVSQYLPEQSLVRLTIEDDGDGFDAEVIERVFEPYVTTKVEGSGLGMAIVQNIIEEHDGHIFVNNVAPRGARITIEFNINPTQEH